METLPPTPDQPEPTPDPPPEPQRPDLNEVLVEERWSGTQYLRYTKLLRLLPKMVVFLEPIHCNLVEEVQDKYRKHDQISRTVHSQLCSILRRYNDVVEQQDLFKEVPKEQGLHAVLIEAIEEAVWLESQCEQRADERRKKKSEGNVKIVAKVTEKY